MTLGKVLRRFGLTLLIAVVFTVGAALLTINNVVHGPSQTVRDMLIRAAIQASATKWVPGLFFDEELINSVMTAETQTETIAIADLIPPTPRPTQMPQDVSAVAEVPESTPEPDPWENAPDDMRLEIYNGSTFKGYILLVKDPARVYTGKCRSTFAYGAYGDQIFSLIDRGEAIAATNAGGFDDPGGHGGGGTPLGLTYSGGECLWDDGSDLTFIGFDSDNRLVAENHMTRAQADALGIRDAVSFQTNKVLINRVDGEVTAYYADSDTSLAQRTAIGQAADGTVILMVTEGRTSAYLGANREDIINAMLEYGAVTAAMLDGGSSAMLCYPGYYDNYEVDETQLNKFQRQGLVNSYRAFTPPRAMPTFWAVKPLDGGNAG
ncbi:MAG: phosphodiester glycosidase family protein [Oscillospiraceae bacterium]|jgi:exopolysaccharide biosynthesis protein|nr:phosphodiester glycosidase family protein [Oscillospiraceae bacterium]